VERRLRVPDDLPVRGGVSARAWTDEQAAAIADATPDLLLSAAAGSGKTSVLVERFVRHVTDEGVAPRRVLAITFTEKAAGELEQRVRDRLFALGRGDLARELEGGWISTVHGFCARLLRAHAVPAGLDPRFAVVDEPLARELRGRAWDEAFGAWLDDRGEPALDLAGAYGADRLRLAIEDVHDALRSGGATVPRLPLPGPRPAPDPAPLRAARAAAAAELGAAAPGKTVGVAVAALERCGEVLDALAPGALPDPGPLAAGAFRAGNTKALKTPAVCAYLEAHAAFAQACADHRGAAAAVELDALLDRYARAYAAAKRARAGLDFDDLELLARDLLRDHPAIRAAYAERFERVLVDEFQDSNPLQVELFGLVAPGRAVTVGDELQSIYRFRHADVEVFRARRAAVASRALTRNFRSRPEVLAPVNAAFAHRLGDAFTPLVAGREPAAGEAPAEPLGGRSAEPLGGPSAEPVGDPAAAAAPRVDLLLTAPDGWGGEDLGDLPLAPAWRQAEARLLAQHVAGMVAGGEAAPEDVVVLLRATGDLPVYERALQDAGLATLSAAGGGYWARQVVRDLCAWLAALANPHDELALLGVLASPLVGASTDALALLMRRGQGTLGATLAGDLDALPLGDDDRTRLTAFAARFAHERALAPRLGLDELLRRAVEASDYDLHVLRLPGGERRLANVHKLMRLAAEHERAHGRDVRGLADRARAELEAEARESDAPVELGEARAVRLMTIHAAKGLEFPVVCVADLGRGPGNDAPAVLVDAASGRLGVRLANLDGTSAHALDYKALYDERRAADRAEEDRILYVALTRAEERLVLSGACRNGSAPVGWLAPVLEGRDDVRVLRSAPGDGVLRAESWAAGAHLRPAPPPPARPPVALPPAPPPRVRSLSYSGLQLWRSCGYRFHLQRGLGLPENRDERRGAPPGGPGPPPEQAGIEARLRGSLAHEALEADPQPDAARDAVLAVVERHEVEVGEDELADLTSLVAAFAATPLARRVAEAGRVHREQPFAFPLDDAMVNGVVDVLAHEADGTTLVVDYKTDLLAPGADLHALVERDYAVQWRIYALAALRAGAPGVEVAYAFLMRPEEPVSHVRVAADVPALEAELRDLAAGLLAGEYAVSPTPHWDLCAGCPGRGTLCSHPVELTERPAPA